MARRRRKVLVPRSVSRCLSWALALGALSIAATPARAQGGARPPATRVDSADALSTALDAEDKGELKKAAVAYREVLQRALIPGNSDGDKVALSLLGLERVWAELGMRDSIIPVAQRVVQLRPTDPVARSIQLRALVSIGRDE